MQNRLLNYLAPSGPEFYTVHGSWGWIRVSRDVAQHVMRQLRRRFRPRWVRIYDLTGSEMWLLTRSIELVIENTCEQRAAERNLRRELEAEENGGDGYQDFRTA